MIDKKSGAKSRKAAAISSAVLLAGTFILSVTISRSNAAMYAVDNGVAIAKDITSFSTRGTAFSQAEPVESHISNSTSMVVNDISEESVIEEPLPLIFDASDVRVPSNITEEQLHLFILRYCPEWVGLEETILQYDSRINLIFLLAVARAETWAGSAVVGDYNCFNTKDFYTGEYVDYESYAHSIDAFVRLIENQYLSEDGLWWEGGYSVEKIGMHYATPVWAEGITKLAEEIKWLLEEKAPLWKAELEAQQEAEQLAVTSEEGTHEVE